MKTEVKKTSIKDVFLLIIYNENSDGITSQGFYINKNDLYNLSLQIRDQLKNDE